MDKWVDRVSIVASSNIPALLLVIFFFIVFKENVPDALVGRTALDHVRIVEQIPTTPIPKAKECAN